MIVSLERAVCEALGFFEAFRKMGFPADDIYFQPGHGSLRDELMVFLRAQGLQFAGSCGQVAEQSPEVMSSLNEAITTWNDPTTPDSWRQEIYENSLARRNSVSLVTALAAKGFDLSKTREVKP